jgi:hypothetical protein
MTVDADIARWKEMSDLTFELADTVYTLFNAIIDFCKKNNIPIQEQEGLWNLTRKTKAIFSEIEQISASYYKRPSDEFLQGHKSDEDFTEPFNFRFL